MAGRTFEMTKDRARHENSSPQFPARFSSQQSSRGNTGVSPSGSLTDPLVQDLNHASRKYLFYFASDVCGDFVLYDMPKHNPFRELIPLTHQHPVLLHIIIANSALHMSNACQKSFALDAAGFPLRHRTSLPGSPCSSSSAMQQLEYHNDALAAKQRALHLLKTALTSISSADIDVTLAVVLLFIEFELIDSGRDNWRYHINGARSIIATLFDILGSTFACSIGLVPRDTFSTGALSLLQDAEGNHCSSFPTILLQLMRSGAQLSQPNHPSSPLYSATGSKQQQALLLLYAAQSFDPLAWAINLQPRSPATDLLHRTHVASAHRAAVCIYLSRVLLSLYPTTPLSHELESLVADIITHLSFIRPSDALFTATTWPAFIAGAETNDGTRQEWVARRFQELWEVEPWGLIRGALGVLERIWMGRSGVVVNGEGTPLRGKKGDGDWIGDLRGRGVDWLIL
ncbi:MAG: hypothetical protein M1818_003580 [Claussenomyces sp. TS43310]|nr:MAG: hypothetical protein M1818_003580 [Claussenomyces sp. TS43310]